MRPLTVSKDAPDLPGLIGSCLGLWLLLDRLQPRVMGLSFARCCSAV